MTGTAADVIRVAKSQVGYHEGYSGGHWTNYQKYSPAVPGLEWSQNQAWCATFVSWVALQAGAADLFPRTASCATGVSWFRQRDRFSEYPAIGAQVFFGTGGGSHTGIVYAYDPTYVYTVEGNTNTSGGAEGDGVYLKKRIRRDAYVYGYGYPAYAAGIVTADPDGKNPAPPQEDAVTLTKADVYDAVWKSDKVPAPPDAPDYATNALWQPQSYLKDTNARVRVLQGTVAALSATNAKLVDTVAQLAGRMGDLDPAAIVAELTSAIESIDIRLDVPDTPAS